MIIAAQSLEVIKRKDIPPMKVRWIVVLNAANHILTDDPFYRFRSSVVSKSKQPIGVNNQPR